MIKPEVAYCTMTDILTDDCSSAYFVLRMVLKITEMITDTRKGLVTCLLILLRSWSLYLIFFLSCSLLDSVHPDYYIWLTHLGPRFRYRSSYKRLTHLEPRFRYCSSYTRLTHLEPRFTCYPSYICLVVLEPHFTCYPSYIRLVVDHP
jgi:hypothetical protein